MLQSRANFDIMEPAKQGWIRCPVCGNTHLKKVFPDETADLVYIHCKKCKNYIPLTLKNGVCLHGQGQRDMLRA